MEQCPLPTESPFDRQRATVFFDGGCPMCRREIAHYQRLDAAGRIRWLARVVAAVPGLIPLLDFAYERFARWRWRWRWRRRCRDGVCAS